VTAEVNNPTLDTAALKRHLDLNVPLNAPDSTKTIRVTTSVVKLDLGLGLDFFLSFEEETSLFFRTRSYA